jgi:hypothetical protein
MYGVPKDLDIPGLVGDRLDYITTCEYQISFGFDGGTTISVQSEIDIVRDGLLVARWDEDNKWSPGGFSQCVGASVESFAVPDQHKLQIRLQGGWIVTIYDQPHYEAFHIEPLGIHV